MAISDKLNYLIETKQLFKDRLNSLGAEITSSTTFRNYLNWLDTFYGEVSDKTDISENGVVGRTSQNTAILPSEYTQVDYIESHGAEYIDTGVNADTNLRVILDMAFTRGGNANQNVGAINLPGGSANARYHILTGGSTNDYIRIFINDNGLNLGLWDNDRHLFDINPLEGYASYDDTIRTIPTNIKDVGLNFWLFGRNAIGATLYYSYVKQWACKMYYNNELVRDFIPCYRNSDNEVGLYDIVNDVFYTNQGTGAFTYGSVVNIPNPDYPQPINNLTGNVAYKITTQNGEQTFTIPLGDIELCNIDTYEDKIYSSDGRFYLNKNIGKKIYNNVSLNVLSIDAKQSGLLYRSFNIRTDYVLASSVCYCDKLKYSEISIFTNDIQGIKPTSTRGIKVKIFDSSLQSIEDFQSWLSNNNLLVYYMMDEPTTTEITQENYPSLYNALKQIQDYLTAYKINKEFILGYSSPEIEY